MTSRHPRSPVFPGESAPPVGFRDELRSIKGLTPYIWPRDRADLRLRVVAALVCLIIAKFVNIAVPLLYKQAVDALTPGQPGIAIEPMTCAPNAFRSGDGLVVLQPGESWSGSWGILR